MFQEEEGTKVSLQTRMAELEQQLTIEERNKSKTSKYYRRMTELSANTKGN